MHACIPSILTEPLQHARYYEAAADAAERTEEVPALTKLILHPCHEETKCTNKIIPNPSRSVSADCPRTSGVPDHRCPLAM